MAQRNIVKSWEHNGVTYRAILFDDGYIYLYKVKNEDSGKRTRTRVGDFSKDFTRDIGCIDGLAQKLGIMPIPSFIDATNASVEVRVA
jgi:hypothetical protein